MNMSDERLQGERERFEAHFHMVEFPTDQDAWGRWKYKHSHVQSLWVGWQARAALASDAQTVLKQIHDVVMCIGAVTEAPESDPYTLRAVKQMAMRLNAQRLARDAEPVGWIPLTQCLPDPSKHDRVLIYTEGTDFAGEQFFDVAADSLNECFYESPEDQPEVCRAATHWMARPFPTEVAQPIVPNATRGHTFPPQESGDPWTAGINLGRHGNAIECYRETEQEAEALRDIVLEAITSPQAGAQVERDAKDARLLRGLIELCGHVADGSDTVVSLYQDDASRDWIVATGVQGRRKTLGWARGPKEAIDAAIDSAKREG